MEHAKEYQVSSAPRWIRCPKSISLSRGIAQKSSVYADEGTKAHEIAYNLITGKSISDQNIGPDMLDAVGVYVDYIRSEIKARPHAYTAFEKRVDLGWAIPGCFGTLDAVICETMGKMTIADYKHGQGLYVSPENNFSLMLYALGMLGPNNGEIIQEVELVIVQPRCGSEVIRKWSITPEHLYAWYELEVYPAYLSSVSDEPEVCAGLHCRFCPAISICKHIAEETLSIARHEFGSVENILPAPDVLSREDMIKVLSMKPIISAWLEACSERAVKLLKCGTKIPGFKLVKKRTHRKWSGDINDHLYRAFGLDAFSPKTPAQVEYLCSTLSLDASLMSGHIESVEGGLTIAPSSDRRKEVSPDFTEISGSEKLDDCSFIC